MDIELAYYEHKEPGYRWVVTATEAGCTTSVTFATEAKAQQYILFCQLHNEVL